MHDLIPAKTCPECGDPVRGRADKKFCSDHCRVSYNNRLNNDETSYMRNVNHALRKNRRLLSSLKRSGKKKVTRERLIQVGFDFNYFTSTHTAKDGAICYYCYEQGYRLLENERYLLVAKQDIL